MSAVATTQIAPKSVLRHRTIHSDKFSPEQPVVTRASRTSQRPVQTEAIPCWKVTQTPTSLAQKNTTHWLLTLGSGMLITLLIVLLGQLLLGWVGTMVDDLRYGYPRTFQMDAFVGHEHTGQPSHFVAINLKGQIEVIELPGGDAAHARIFVGPQLYGPEAALMPVTLQFLPPKGSHIPDMHLLFQQTTIIFHNTQGTFVASS